MPVSFRKYAGSDDAEAQYALWLRATEGLPFAWRSSLANVRALSRHAPQHRGSRIFAERDRQLVGYIGTHPPFAWEGQGAAVPFGFPWTHPQDGGLEAELYHRMLDATPQVYRGARIDFYIQRFRRSWQRQHQFVRARGWCEAWREPILARPVPERSATTAPAGRPIIEADLEGVAALIASDPTCAGTPDASMLQRSFEHGWCDRDSAWHIPGLGALAIEVRRPWAEVKLFASAPGELENMLAQLDARAAVHGAEVVYFTLGPNSSSRREALETSGFTHADDDVYVRLDLA